MPVHNVDIAKIFEKIGDLLEIEDANPFRVRAYRNAARTVSSMGREVADLIAENEDLTSLAGIGKDLAGKIKTIVETGALPLLEELEKGISGELTTLLDVEGLGPKRVAILHKELGITDRKGLKKAAEAGKVRELSGFGRKTELKILEDLGRAKEGRGRILLAEAEPSAESYRDYLRKVEGVKKVTVAGSYRRRRETVGDLDILVACSRDSPVMERFAAYEEVARVISRGDTRSTVVLRSGLQVDLRVLPGASYGAALHYFTGSKAHNIAVRKIGLSRGLKINEYGVYRGKKKVAGATEREVYAKVDLPYIEPELREDRGEIEAARNNELPELITLADIKGDLHSHTVATDGKNTIEEMARAAKELDYEYLAVTDHSRRVTVANGLDESRLREEMERIDALNEKLSGITLLKGIEVDILKDGSLDLPDGILRDLDIVVGSVHSKFNLAGDEQTERIIRAMDNRYFNILAHPTGRMLGKRQAYEVDMERLMRAAKERGVFMELNSQPERMDLTDIQLKSAKEIGVGVVISTDAHWGTNLNYMRFGVGQARRGWLAADDVVNTRSLAELRRLLKR
ncbi:MAG: DNA polymerase/3'-5' exonuclease PolX [Desulfurivibrionaceae bacterium]